MGRDKGIVWLGVRYSIATLNVLRLDFDTLVYYNCLVSMLELFSKYTITVAKATHDCRKSNT